MQESAMSILKSEQILADSKTSWQDAAESAVKRFARTVRNVRSVYVNDLSAVIDRGEIEGWRVNLQVTFEVDEPARAKAAAAKARTAMSRRAPRKPARKTSKRA
jgi:flavin-binding protein dodecin